MNNKLYVGNLPWRITEEELMEYFKQAGEVLTTTIILDRDTGRSRGFGFVEMKTIKGAQKALKELDNTYLASRQIIVRQARPENSENINQKHSVLNDFIESKAKIGDEMGFTINKKHFTIKRNKDIKETIEDDSYDGADFGTPE